MIASNYRIFGERDKASRTWFVTILVTIAILAIAFLIPENLSKSAGPLLVAAYSVTAGQMIRTYQSEQIARHKALGGAIASGWQAAGAAVVWLIILLAALFTVAFLAGDLSGGGEGVKYTERSYGTMQHTIYFDDQNMTIPEVDAIAMALTRTGFFDDEMHKSVLLTKEEDTYLLMVSAVVGIANMPDGVAYFTALKDRITANCHGKKIVLLLAEDGDSERIVKRIE